MENYLSLADALSDLRQKGYEADFSAEREAVCLYCGEFDMRLDPTEFHVDEVHRFYCSSGHDDNSILYAISDPASGIKGTLVDSFGTSCSVNIEILNHLRASIPFA